MELRNILLKIKTNKMCLSWLSLEKICFHWLKNVLRKIERSSTSSTIRLRRCYMNRKNITWTWPWKTSSKNKKFLVKTECKSNKNNTRLNSKTVFNIQTFSSCLESHHQRKTSSRSLKWDFQNGLSAMGLISKH